MSDETQAAADDLTRRKDALLEAVLPNVLFDGWSSAALATAARSLDLPADEAAALFPGGAEEVRQWLDEWADRGMLAALEQRDFTGLRRHQRVGEAVKARLDLLAPHREAVRLAIAARFSPRGPFEASRAVYRTVDRIWWAIGDGSTDFSFYTKRAMLAALYSAAVLYWLNDTSEDSADTHDFIDRRLEDLIRLPSLKTSLRDAARRFTAPFDLMRREVRR